MLLMRQYQTCCIAQVLMHFINCLVWNRETFKQISSPYFGLHVKPRVEVFFESVGSAENAYIDTRMLLKRFSRSFTLIDLIVGLESI